MQALSDRRGDRRRTDVLSGGVTDVEDLGDHHSRSSQKKKRPSPVAINMGEPPTALDEVTTTGAPPEFFPGGTPQPSALPAVSGSGSPASYPGDQPLNSPLNPTNEAQSSGGGLGGLIRTVKRRQTVLIATFAVVTGALAINTLRQRIFSPVYQGGFQMQISNPFDDKSGAGRGGSVETIARSEITADVPSLIVLMRSPLLIGPVAQRQGVPIRELQKNLSIRRSLRPLTTFSMSRCDGGILPRAKQFCVSSPRITPTSPLPSGRLR